MQRDFRKWTMQPNGRELLIQVFKQPFILGDKLRQDRWLNGLGCPIRWGFLSTGFRPLDGAGGCTIVFKQGQMFVSQDCWTICAIRMGTSSTMKAASPWLPPSNAAPYCHFLLGA